jgi:hypothetical protein
MLNHLSKRFPSISWNHRLPLQTYPAFSTTPLPARSVARPPSRFRTLLPKNTKQISTRISAHLDSATAEAARIDIDNESTYSTSSDRSASFWPTSSHDHPLNYLGVGTSDKADDEALRALFDQPLFHAHSKAALSPTGLFLHPLLTTPQALAEITQQTLIHAHHLVDRVSSIAPSFTPSFPDSPFSSIPASSPYEQSLRIRQLPKMLDRLSDTICLVIDMCELIRNVHPGEDWVRQADASYEILGSFMNGLNTHTGLYEVRFLRMSKRRGRRGGGE